MLYISKDRSAVMLEEGVYLHVYNPRLSDAPEGSIPMRVLDKKTDVLEYTFRDGSSLSIHREHSGVVCADLYFKFGSICTSVTFGVSESTLPSDPVVRVLETRDRVVIPLLEGNVDLLDASFFDAPFFPVALIAYDAGKNMFFLDAPAIVPSISIREVGEGKDILDVLKTIIETLEQAGVKVVLMEV